MFNRKDEQPDRERLAKQARLLDLRSKMRREAGGFTVERLDDDARQELIFKAQELDDLVRRRKASRLQALETAQERQGLEAEATKRRAEMPQPIRVDVTEPRRARKRKRANKPEPVAPDNPELFTDTPSTIQEAYATPAKAWHRIFGGDPSGW